MRPGPFVLFILAVGAMSALPAVLFVSLPSAPQVYCPRDSSANKYFSVPARQTLLAIEPPLEEGPFLYSWITIRSNSTALYVLFLLDGSQWLDYPSSTSSPPVGTAYGAPPSIYYWSSGPVTSTNWTLHYSPQPLNWYLLVENPGSAAEEVGETASVCLHPS